MAGEKKKSKDVNQSIITQILVITEKTRKLSLKEKKKKKSTSTQYF